MNRSELFSIKQPSKEQIWSTLQRLMSFEDPLDRWQKILALVSKQVGSDRLKQKEIPLLPLAAQDYLFSSVFGPNVSDAAGTVFNIILGLADIRRFKPIVFDSRLTGASEQFSSKELKRMFPDNLDSQLTNHLAELLHLENGERRWLEHAYHAVPNWSILRAAGPWQNDPRAVLANDFMKELKLSKQINAADFMRGNEHFEKLLRERRNVLPSSFLPELIVMVEGGTEAILLPHFARLLKVDFARLGVYVLSAGGSKQMVRKFLEMRDSTSLPIMMIFDADAEEQTTMAKDALREDDRLYRWEEGEIEDTLPLPLLVDQINAFFYASGITAFVSASDFPAERRRTEVLNQVWRQRGLGDFDKIGFAETLARNMNDVSRLPANVVHAIRTIEGMAGASK